jgi:hypothetical protein
MNKALVWTAAGGLLLSAVCLSASAAMSDGWRDLPWREMFHRDAEYSGPRDRTIIDRTLTWEGDAEALTINVPAEVLFTDGPEARVVAHGPAWLVNQLEMDDGDLRTDRRIRHLDDDDLKLTITAPNVRAFKVNGAAKLTIKDIDNPEVAVTINGASEVSLENLKSQKVSIHVNGAGDVSASGQVDALTLKISGAGDADLGRLKARSADLAISGMGEITAAPTEEAEVSIAGAGEVKLLTRPPRLRTHIAGAGNISQPDGDAAPAASAAPSAKPARAAPAPPPIPKPPSP